MTAERKKGVVIKSTGSWYGVECSDGSEVECRVKGKFRLKGIKSTNPVSVGDRVVIEMEDDGVGSITELEDRDNYIIRQSVNLSKQSHVIAANLDQCILVITVKQPTTLLGFVDRILVSAESFRIPVVIVINKTDLNDGKDLATQSAWLDLYGRIGYRCLLTSALQGTGMEEFKELLADKVNLLSGNSGVGKSALINRVAPSLDLKTANVSKAYDTGRHTTTNAAMHKLDFGGYVIDSPGIKSFGLYDLEKEHLGHYYPEMRALLGECKYPNCLHVNEPGCAVKLAVESADIAESRYRSYLDMMDGLDKMTYRRS